MPAHTTKKSLLSYHIIEPAQVRTGNQRQAAVPTRKRVEGHEVQACRHLSQDSTDKIRYECGSLSRPRSQLEIDIKLTVPE